MLLGFPADELLHLLLLHPLHLDFLNDHVAAADGRDDGRRLDVRAADRGLDGVGHDAGIHHLAFDDVVHSQLASDLVDAFGGVLVLHG